MISPADDLRQHLVAAVRDGGAMMRLAVGLMRYPLDAAAVTAVLGGVSVASLDGVRPLPPVADTLTTAAAYPATVPELVTTLPHPDGSEAWWSHVLCRAADEVIVVSSLNRPDAPAARCVCLSDGGTLWFWLDAADEPLDLADAALASAASELAAAGFVAAKRSDTGEGKQ